MEYGKVVLGLRQAGLPEVFAAIPYQESRYSANARSEVCAEGYWQFMPEVAHRVEMNHSDRFWALCRRLCPDMAQHRAWLKTQGPALHRFDFDAS